MSGVHRKSFTFGMGTGILLLTVVFFFAYGYQKGQWQKQNTIPSSEMTEQEIINAAKKLGMAFYVGGDTVEPTGNKAQEPSMAVNDQEIVNRAIGMGMIFPGDGEIAEESETTEQESDFSDDTEGHTVYQVVGMPAFGEQVSILIQEGLLATEVADMLVEKGVLTDAQAFIEFLAQTNSTKKLCYGEYVIPAGADFETIARIIKR